MGKNTTSQKKRKKGKKDGETDKNDYKNIPLACPKEYKFYGYVEKTLGNCRFLVKIIIKDSNLNSTINIDEYLIAHLPRSQKRGGYINNKMIVLVSHRQFENKLDILYLYKDNESRYLADRGEIPSYLLSGLNDINNKFDENEDDYFDFDNESTDYIKKDDNHETYEMKMPTSDEESEYENEDEEEDDNDNLKMKTDNFGNIITESNNSNLSKNIIKKI